MKFGPITRLLLFGGSRILAELALYLRNRKYQYAIYTSPRQLQDVIYPDGRTLKKCLKNISAPYISTEDINRESDLLNNITPHTLGLGLGEAWSFSGKIIKRFNGRLLDLMGIRMPQYRGGAHYSWQILRGSRIGGCNLQIINEDMVQGVFDSGDIIKAREYLFPSSVRIPEDYFKYAVEQEISFLAEFLSDVKSGKDFKPQPVQEIFSLYFPRLNTRRHGFINWSWKSDDLDRFICAFGAPYAGASTFLNQNRVFLNDSSVERNDGTFHPFQNGLVYRTSGDAVFIAAGDGTLVVRRVIDEQGADITRKIKIGQRFHTPSSILEDALCYHTDYSKKSSKAKSKR